MESNLSQAVLYAQPESEHERYEIAAACQIGLKLSIPVLVDDMLNTADLAFNGWPERVVLSSGRSSAWPSTISQFHLAL